MTSSQAPTNVDDYSALITLISSIKIPERIKLRFLNDESRSIKSKLTAMLPDKQKLEVKEEGENLLFIKYASELYDENHPVMKIVHRFTESREGLLNKSLLNATYVVALPYAQIELQTTKEKEQQKIIKYYIIPILVFHEKTSGNKLRTTFSLCFILHPENDEVIIRLDEIYEILENSMTIQGPLRNYLEEINKKIKKENDKENNAKNKNLNNTQSFDKNNDGSITNIPLLSIGISLTLNELFDNTLEILVKNMYYYKRDQNFGVAPLIRTNVQDDLMILQQLANESRSRSLITSIMLNMKHDIAPEQGYPWVNWLKNGDTLFQQKLFDIMYLPEVKNGVVSTTQNLIKFDKLCINDQFNLAIIGIEFFEPNKNWLLSLSHENTFPHRSYFDSILGWTVSASMSISILRETTRSFFWEIEKEKKLEILLEVSRQIVDDFKEIYDLEIASISYRIEYENMRKLALLDEDFKHLENKLKEIREQISIKHLNKTNNYITKLSILIAIYTVANILATVSVKLISSDSDFKNYSYGLISITVIVGIALWNREISNLIKKITSGKFSQGIRSYIMKTKVPYVQYYVYSMLKHTGLINNVSSHSKENIAKKLYSLAVSHSNYDDSFNIKVYSLALDYNSEYYDALCNRGLLLGDTKKYEDSLKDLRKVLENQPHSADVLYAIGLVKIKQAENFTNINEYLLLMCQGFNYYNRSLGKKAEYDPPKKGKVAWKYLMLEKANMLIKDGKLNDALIIYDVMITKLTNVEDILIEKGKILHKLGQDQDAITCLNQIPDNYFYSKKVLYLKAQILSNTRKDETIDILKKVTESDPSYKDEIMNDPEFKNIKNDPKFKQLFN